jgi:hypothetical protein
MALSSMDVHLRNCEPRADVIELGEDVHVDQKSKTASMNYADEIKDI